jgi:ADP-ribose pyrophosphatase YjhB (NUDIX family)
MLFSYLLDARGAASFAGREEEPMSKTVHCPNCATVIETYRNPAPTADVIVEMSGGGIVLIERKNPPIGWALPGGFVDYGESLETCAQREAKEETGLDVELLEQLGTYSDPSRDTRRHTITTVYVARPVGDEAPRAADDASKAAVFTRDSLPSSIVFDHTRILEDYFRWKDAGGGRDRR